MQAINDKIVSLNYGDFRAEIKSVDAQESFNGGVQVLVTGYLTGKDNKVNNFAQSFFLAPQDKGYFVLNDMLRYVDNVALNPAFVSEVVVPIAAPPSNQDVSLLFGFLFLYIIGLSLIFFIQLLPVPAPVPAPVQENHVSEQSTPSAEEAIAGEVYNPPENGELPIVEEEEEPVAEVVDEIQDIPKPLDQSSAKIEEVPKKSYASIVSD